MIIDKEIKITLSGKMIKYYNNIGYNGKNHDKILVKIKDLSKGCNYKINVKCDNCNCESNIIYRDYLKVTKNFQESYYCHVCATKLKNPITNLKKFGCENPSQNDQIKQKKINTCLKNNGYEYIFQSEKFKQNIKEYNLKKFGCENPSQNDQIKQKKINTCLKNNGCEYPQQNSKIHKKQLQSSFKIKSYKELYYQGNYELDFLEKFYNKIKIENSFPIVYKYQTKNKIYHPDFYLPEYNSIIEIKSKYYLNLNLNLNLMKKQVCLDKGYKFIFIIDKNYSELLSMIKN